MLARRGLVHPREHVADVSCRVVCVEFDWSGQAIGPAAGEGVEKGGEDGGLAGGREGGQSVSARCQRCWRCQRYWRSRILDC